MQSWKKQVEGRTTSGTRPRAGNAQLPRQGTHLLSLIAPVFIVRSLGGLFGRLVKTKVRLPSCAAAVPASLTKEKRRQLGQKQTEEAFHTPDRHISKSQAHCTHHTHHRTDSGIVSARRNAGRGRKDIIPLPPSSASAPSPPQPGHHSPLLITSSVLLLLHRRLFLAAHTLVPRLA